MAWDMCNQDSVWSDIEVSWDWARSALQPGLKLPSRCNYSCKGGRARARRGARKVARAGAFARESQSYLNSNKFAILRWL